LLAVRLDAVHAATTSKQLHVKVAVVAVGFTLRASRADASPMGIDGADLAAVRVVAVAAGPTRAERR
jgi:hypothetical protein